MADTISDALRNGSLYTDNETYAFVKLPTKSASWALGLMHKWQNTSSSTRCFQTFMIDKDEITLMIPFKQLQAFKDASSSENYPEYEVGTISYRLITFDIVLAPSLVGFMAVVTRALADSNISVLPFAAFSRDHIFVSDQDFKTAMAVLEKLKTTTIE